MSKNYLVFTNIHNSYNNLNSWLSSYINYDIIINYCGDNSENIVELKNKVKLVTYESDGFIFNILNNLIKNKVFDVKQYKYIAILNENIELERYDISICFELMNNYELYFGSPASISENKDILSCNKNSKLRYTNTIDINKCFININILKQIFNNYSNELEGYGFEYLLLKKYKDLKDKIAIFDIISCKEVKNTYNENDIQKFKDLELEAKVNKYEFCEYKLIEKNHNIFDIKTNNNKITIQKIENPIINNKKQKTQSNQNNQNINSKNIIIKKNKTTLDTSKSQIKSNTLKSSNTIKINNVKKNTLKEGVKKNTTKLIITKSLYIVKKNTTKSNTIKSNTKKSNNTQEVKKNTTKKATNKVEKLIHKPKTYIKVKV